MKKIKIFACILSLTTLLGSVASAADFSDMPSDPAARAVIENAVKNGILAGSTDGTVKPDAYITRAEMASIITRACGAQKEGDIYKFTDVPSDKWYYSAVAKAYEMGALSGSNNKMSPENNITFQECFTILSQVFDLLPDYILLRSMTTSELPANSVVVNNRVYDLSVLTTYNDKDLIADWAKVYVAGVVANGGWNGIDNNLTPTNYITRLQFATVMDNLFKNYIDQPGKYTSLPAGNTMIRCDGVELNGLTTDDDIYIADGVSPNGVSIKNVTVNGRLVIRGCATPIIDENDGITFGDTGILITGHFNKVRVIRPYINLNMVGATYRSNSLYNHKDSCISANIYSKID